MEQYLQLYTWQNPDWDITKKKRDPLKGHLRWGEDSWEKLQSLYKKLEKKLGTLDFAWCFTQYEHWKYIEISRLWVLKVNSLEVFHFIDSEIWGMMVQIVLNNKQLNGINWGNLIVKNSVAIERISAGNKDITPLLLVPLCTSTQIIDKSKFNKGIWYPNAKYEDLPTSECEAKRFRVDRPKPGAWRRR